MSDFDEYDQLFDNDDLANADWDKIESIAATQAPTRPAPPSRNASATSQARQNPPAAKRPRVDSAQDDAHVQMLQDELAKMRADAQRLQGEVTTLRRSKQQEDAGLSAKLFEALQKNRELEAVKIEMSAQFKRDLEAQRTKSAFDRQESEAAARKTKLAQMTQNRNATSARRSNVSPSNGKRSAKKTPTSKMQSTFRGFDNSFAEPESAPRQPSPSQRRSQGIMSQNGAMDVDQLPDLPPVPATPDKSGFPHMDTLADQMQETFIVSEESRARDLRSKISSALLNHRMLPPSVPEAYQESSPIASTSAAVPKPISTFYSLVNIQLPSASSEMLARQTSICTSIFDALGRSEQSYSDSRETDRLVAGIGQGLSDLASLLFPLDLTTHLIACLTLIMHLTTHYPLFGLYFLHGSPERFPSHQPDNTSLHETLAAIIAKHKGGIRPRRKIDFDDEAELVLNPLALGKQNQGSKQPLYLSKKERSDMEIEKERKERSDKVKLQEALFVPVVEVYSALAWNPDANGLNGLEMILSSSPAISQLLDRENAPIVLLRTVETLNLMAGQALLFRSLLDTPFELAPDRYENGVYPLIERLSSYLHYSKTGLSLKQTCAIHTAILDLLSMLSIKNSDAVTLLSESPSLIPRLITRIAYDIGLIFECDGSGHTSLHASMITHRAISAHRLLFYLAASPGSRLLLKIKLDKAIRDYLGIFEMFTVAIGRLAFAEPPDWMREADRRTLEDASGPAQTLLAMVLSPEEEDTIYSLYNDEEEDEDEAQIPASSQTQDEEEMGQSMRR